MAEKYQIAGGFAGTNKGRIKDSYCYFVTSPSLRGRQDTFCGENDGEIFSSFANYRGTLTEQFNSRGMEVSREISGVKDAEFLGYDTAGIWQYEGGKHVLKFWDDKWKAPAGDLSGQKNLTITSVEEFLEFSDSVNGGKPEYINANVKLTCDLDFKNREIHTTGNTRRTAFAGLFDGSEHIIKNFRIKETDMSSHGLFGILSGRVINLTVDCEVSGEGNVGALCGVNDGRIECCGGYVHLQGSGDRLCIGGLCGENNGQIDRCYIATRMHVVTLPLIPIGAAACFVALIGILLFLALPATAEASQTYSSVPPDGNRIRISDEEMPENMGENMLSFRFNETLHINANTGQIILDFQNPSYATTKLVVSLQAENDDGSRTVMAESGAIEPGYGLYYLSLNDAGYELINAGVRDAVIILTAYDANDNDKAMVDSTLPVRIMIDR